ncbi:prepilin-type N-terminal cleavage/methylation domain-containing protein [Pseudohongiella sp. SYSU M77423]|uniref:prepilin-type N-terminal cleavage/methylation domain-containing protein n=1 Tax=Pseudohongiella sp. SYSU M77423 TaxID=3042312 RepID=UPI0024804FDB|nr:prepilin-type N-terminal cleavage/methylation domain-containing protein [Pseudohongiella sp. SYSU M77423]MDH7942549.1 prepilin-type N-terminal cleavage/methylation domain-containing protein [Pseudohongiella sp. SYSU M77423]
MRINTCNRQRGFSLLELSVVLVLLAGAALLLVQGRSSGPDVSSTDTLLASADEQLIYFLAIHSRLPCPDFDGDGREDCGGSASSKGTLPYRTLGMRSSAFSLQDLPLRYSVYRRNTGGSATTLNATDADLTARRNRFEPVMANGELVSVQQVGAPDFCQALATAHDSSFSASFTYTASADSSRNVAYALAAPGRQNSDGQNGLFDGRNGVNGAGFEMPNAAATSQYDDRVLARDFDELYTLLNCGPLIQTMNLLANGHQAEVEVADTLASNQESTAIGAALNGIGLALNAVDLVQSGFGVITATTQITAAASLLSGAISGCFALVGCALIPVYAASLASAIAGLASAVVAVASAAIATAGQLTTTGLYVAAAISAGIATASYDQLDYDETIGQVEDQLSEARNDRGEIVAARDNAKSRRDPALQKYQASRDKVFDYIESSKAPGDTSDAAVSQRISAALTATDEVQEARNNLELLRQEEETKKTECEYRDEDTAAEDFPACTQLDNLADQVAEAETQVGQKNLQRTLAVAEAVAAANSHPVYISDGADGPVYQSCDAVPGCTLGEDIWLQEGLDENGNEIASGMIGDYDSFLFADIEYQNEVERLEQHDDMIVALEDSEQTLRCMSQELGYDPNTGQCVDPDDNPDAVTIVLVQGGEAVIEAVSARSLMGAQ